MGVRGHYNYVIIQNIFKKKERGCIEKLELILSIDIMIYIYL